MAGPMTFAGAGAVVFLGWESHGLGSAGNSELRAFFPLINGEGGLLEPFWGAGRLPGLHEPRRRTTVTFLSPQMEGDLSELAHHASEARLTASAMRAQLSVLRTGVGVFSPAAERPSPYSGGGGGTSRSLGGSSGGGGGEEPPAARLFMFTPARALGVGRDPNGSRGDSCEQQETPEVCRSSSRRKAGQDQVSDA